MNPQQLSLFPEPPDQNTGKKQPSPKLRRYERIQQALETTDRDPYKIYIDISERPVAASTYNFLDLFCGAGGMTLGLLQGGLHPVASVEINPIASATHIKNFPQCHHFNGDIQQFNSLEWLAQVGTPPIHLVVGGPPCQGFSLAGKRDPEDPRNLLFREFLRVVAEIRPWYVVMENVPGILTMSQGAVKAAILEGFAAIGYDRVSIAILESAAYGVPQIRPRAIFIANRFGLDNPYPQPQLSPEEYQPIEGAIDDLPPWTTIPEINHQWTRHSPEYMQRLATVSPGGSLYSTYADAFKRQYPGQPSMTVKENHGGTHIHPHLNRCLSAREMARLQTFPDAFIFQGSMKKAMWQIGNAVPPRLAECIGLALIPALNRM